MLNRTDRYLLELLKASYLKVDLSAEVTEEMLKAVVKTAEAQGVAGLVFDALSQLPKECIYHSLAYHQAMSAFMKIERQYPKYHQAIADLAGFFRENGLQMLLFKGEDLRRNWVKPELRPTGDIDISLCRTRDKDQEFVLASKEGDLLLREKLNVSVTKSNLGHHSHIDFQGYLVENHYEFSNTYWGGRRMKNFERTLQELAWKNRVEAGIFPTANFNAVFLMWHLSTHFCTETVSLRQIYDWLMFLRVHHNDIDWEMVEKCWEDAGMKKFADGVNGLLIRCLGADKAWFPEFEHDETLNERILDDILHGERRSWFTLSNMFHYFKSHWKYKICTGESGFTAFLQSAWMHIVHKGDLVEKDVESS